VSVKLHHVNLVVQDMEAMTGFYQRLGLRLVEQSPEWAAHHQSTDGEATDLHLDSEQFTRVWNRGWAGGTGAVLVFGVEFRSDVVDMYRELTDAGYLGAQAPYDAFWGARFAVVVDPDGNSVGLMSESDPDRRSAPPPPPFH
jgi:catechol 2,3-dioxygenase-like lactoylglutathione lyase family enzyme